MKYKIIRYLADKAVFRQIWTSESSERETSVQDSPESTSAEGSLWSALDRYFATFYADKPNPRILWLPVGVLKGRENLADLKNNTNAEKIILIADTYNPKFLLDCQVNRDGFEGQIDIIFGEGLAAEHIIGCFSEESIDTDRIISVMHNKGKTDSFVSVGKPEFECTNAVQCSLQNPPKKNKKSEIVSKTQKKSESLPATFFSTFLDTLYFYFGPHAVGTRNWLRITMLVLLAIVLLGAFAFTPLAPAAMVAFLGALVLTLKVSAVIGFALTLTMGITGVFKDYYKREKEEHKDNHDYFWLSYLYEFWSENFVRSDKRIGNLIKFSIGLLLFAVVVALLVCTAGVGIVIPAVTAAVHFTVAAFATTGIFVGSSWFAAVFLGFSVMTAYDAICCTIESAFSDCGGDNERKLEDGGEGYGEVAGLHQDETLELEDFLKNTSDEIYKKNIQEETGYSTGDENLKL